MAPLIQLGIALASEFAPAMVRAVAGDGAGEVAGEIVDAAKRITGTDDGDAALAALRSNPALALEFQRLLMEQQARLFESETQRLSEVNASLREEIRSGDPFVRRMRPSFGYLLLAVIGLHTIAFVALLWWSTGHVESAATLLPLYRESVRENLSWMEIALSVLGIYVWKRSDEKQGPPPGGGVFGAIASRIRGAPG